MAGANRWGELPLSNEQINRAWRVDVEPSEKLVLIRLADAANDHDECWHSLATLALDTGLSKSSVCRVLASLEAAGFILRTRERLTTTYRLVLPPDEGKRRRSNKPQPVPPWDKTPPPKPVLPSDTPSPTMGQPPAPPKCPTMGQEPVPPSDTASPTVGHKPSMNPKENPQPLKKSSRQDWREYNGGKAAEANALQINFLAPPEFIKAWERWCTYRTKRATDARTMSEALLWSEDSAMAGMSQCDKHSSRLGWPRIIGQIDQAIDGRWQGLNLEKVPNPTNGRSFSKPRNPEHTASHDPRNAF